MEINPFSLMNGCSGTASKGASSSVVLSIGTHWVELLFLLKPGQHIYVRSDVGLPVSGTGYFPLTAVTGRHCKALSLEGDSALCAGKS